MPYVPDLIALDYETKDDNGASINYHRDDFRIWSLSAAWRCQDGSIRHFFTVDGPTITRFLKRLSALQTKVVVHNLMFEAGCTMAKYPDIDINWHCDTMFLAALYDGGGEIWEEQDDEDWVAGMGLEKCASRVLPKSSRNHKKEAHDWLKQNHKIRSNFGVHLDKLPLNILERYNNADTAITLKLYEALQAELKEIAVAQDWVGWEQPYQFYKTRAILMAKARITGLPVKQTECKQYVEDIDDQLTSLQNRFREWGGSHIEAIEAENREKILSSVKQEKTKEKYRQAMIDDPSIYQFNINSGKQMAELFVNRLGITPPKLTEKGNPSFSTKTIHLWGDGGKILSEKSNRGIVQSQAANIYVDSLYDGNLHVDAKPIGTRTFRVSGGETKN